jgi:multiple sugar transport system permease protein
VFHDIRLTSSRIHRCLRLIEQAGLIDGCSRVSVIWRITLPLAIPALVSVAIYTFMIAWNEFLYALVFLNSRDLFTMPIKINTIFNDPSPRPHVVMAASTIMALPVVTLFLALERFLEEGLTAGGAKGQRRAFLARWAR